MFEPHFSDKAEVGRKPGSRVRRTGRSDWRKPQRNGTIRKLFKGPALSGWQAVVDWDDGTRETLPASSTSLWNATGNGRVQ